MRPTYPLPSRPRFPNPGQLLHLRPGVLLSGHLHIHPPSDAALAALLEWIPTIPRGCEDQVAHPFHRQLLRHYSTSVSSLPQSRIRDQCTWVRSHAPNLPGIADILRTFLASPPPSSNSWIAVQPPRRKPRLPTMQKVRPRRRGTRRGGD